MEPLKPLRLANPFLALAILVVATTARAKPDLTPGVWLNISPPSAQIDQSKDVF